MRSLQEYLEEYYREHPEEIDSFVQEQFDEYAQDGDLGALLSALRIISRVKGVTATAESANLSRKGLQKALSENGNPRFESVNVILHAMGYRLTAQPVVQAQ